jgi:hypothetical protein
MVRSRGVNPLPLGVWSAGQAAKRDPTQHHVSIVDLLTAAFIARHTQFTSIGTFLDASGLEPQSLMDLDAKTRRRWDAFIRATSTFSDWEAMLSTARGEWIFRRIGIFVDA